MILFDRRSFRAFDYVLLSTIGLLYTLGVVLVASAGGPSYFRKQIVFATVAILLAVAVSTVDYRRLRDRAYLLWGLVVLSLVGLLAFGGVFALNSALHSYLILAFSRDERVTLDVGFYYMSNAAGRLLGTLLSGLCYQVAGVAGCLGMAALLLALGWIATQRLAGLRPEPA